MEKWILMAALMIVAIAPAEASSRKAHHPKPHHARVATVVYPDSVTLEGKEYKVCKPGMQDDCVQPRQAGLGFGNRPTDAYRPHKDPHP